jgi:hypothetical protein
MTVQLRKTTIQLNGHDKASSNVVNHSTFNPGPTNIPRPVEAATMAPTEQELTDAKLRTVSAETETRFAQLIGKIDSSNADLKGELKAMSAHFAALERSTAGVKGTIIGTVAAALVITIAILGYGQQWFGIGMSTRDIVRQTVKEMHDQPAQRPNNEQK